MKYTYIAGVDEAGRGPLAGPVIASAVILQKPIPDVTDSKKLSDKKRRHLADVIRTEAICYAMGRAEVDEIDQLNIHHATLLAMQRAVLGLSVIPEKVLVDGLFVPKLSMVAEAIVQGDILVQCIGAASILAKVMRDDEMIRLDTQYPGYGFHQHKGYGTKAHQEALTRLGASPVHRKSFAPVRAVTAPPLG